MGRMAEAARESRRQLKGMFDQLERGLRLFDQVEDAEVSRVGGAASFAAPPPFPSAPSGLGPSGQPTVTTNTNLGSGVTTTSDRPDRGRVALPLFVWDVTRTVSRPLALLQAQGTPWQGPKSAFGTRLRGWTLGQYIFLDPTQDEDAAPRLSAGGGGGGGTAASDPSQRAPTITPANAGERITPRSGPSPTGAGSRAPSSGSVAAGSTTSAVDRMRTELGQKLDRVSTQLQGGGLASALRRAR